MMCQVRLRRGQGMYELGFSIFSTGTGNLQSAEILCQVYYVPLVTLGLACNL